MLPHPTTPTTPPQNSTLTDQPASPLFVASPTLTHNLLPPLTLGTLRLNPLQNTSSIQLDPLTSMVHFPTKTPYTGKSYNLHCSIGSPHLWPIHYHYNHYHNSKYNHNQVHCNNSNSLRHRSSHIGVHLCTALGATFSFVATPSTTFNNPATPVPPITTLLKPPLILNHPCRCNHHRKIPTTPTTTATITITLATKKPHHTLPYTFAPPPFQLPPHNPSVLPLTNTDAQVTTLLHREKEKEEEEEEKEKETATMPLRHFSPAPTFTQTTTN